MERRADLLAALAADPALAALADQVRARAPADPGHDFAHFLRVALWTVRIAASERARAPGDPETDVAPREAIAAALLHDIVNVPKDSPERARASELCAAEARAILPRYGFEPAAVDRIAEAIVDHSFSRGAVPRSGLGRALQDADRLEAVGVIGVFRTLSTGVHLGADYFDGDDPWARGRPLDDKRHSLDHFFVKLLRLAATMRTAAGREEAQRRTRRMRQILAWLGDEIGDPPPPDGEAFDG